MLNADSCSSSYSFDKSICKSSSYPSVPQNSRVFYNSSVIDKILVVDNINNPLKFTSSKRILTEIHDFFPDLKVDFAYALAKGGIVI